MRRRPARIETFELRFNGKPAMHKLAFIKAASGDENLANYAIAPTVTERVISAWSHIDLLRSRRDVHEVPLAAVTGLRDFLLLFGARRLLNERQRQAEIRRGQAMPGVTVSV